jgi:ABC-type histidine transport system ATPase subunit
MKKFIKPDFTKRSLELRFEDETICIYGTKEGLLKMAELCRNLANNPNQGHIHIEDCRILTEESKKGAIAIFDE